VPDSALTRLATAVLDVPVPERALVCGCGDGEPVLFLAREFLSARVRGTDTSAERVRAASARVGLDPEGRVAFKQSTPRRLPFPDQFFDLVVVFEGRPAPSEIARVMRPDAHLILVSSPPAGWLGSIRQRLWQRRLPLADI
jgi:ubiquinone/menaquinone biosynthesis C-methylase UbiE